MRVLPLFFIDTLVKCDRVTNAARTEYLVGLCKEGPAPGQQSNYNRQQKPGTMQFPCTAACRRGRNAGQKEFRQAVEDILVKILPDPPPTEYCQLLSRASGLPFPALMCEMLSRDQPGENII